jgi:D-Tyr-tRNAtyr deacylase
VYVGISKEDFEKENIISQAVSKLLNTKFIYDPSRDKISLSISDID